MLCLKIALVFMIIGFLSATTIINNGKHGYSIVQKHDSPGHIVHQLTQQIVKPKSLIEIQNTGSNGILNNNGKGTKKIGNRWNNGYENGYGNGGLYSNGYDGQYAEYYHYPKYTFKYGVKDQHTGDNKNQWEYRDGDFVKGGYSLQEPDGTIRVVEYTSDKHKGFNAIVKNVKQHQNPQQHLLVPQQQQPTYFTANLYDYSNSGEYGRYGLAHDIALNGGNAFSYANIHKNN